MGLIRTGTGLLFLGLETLAIESPRFSSSNFLTVNVLLPFFREAALAALNASNESKSIGLFPKFFLDDEGFKV